MENYNKGNIDAFLNAINTLTGITHEKLVQYSKNNNLFNILEHPDVIQPSPRQKEKISQLNEFITLYKLLKIQEKDIKVSLNSSSKAGNYFSSILSGIKDKEQFLAAFLDSSSNIIETRVFSEGTIGETVVYPRQILKAALDCHCRSLILSHNHPGGTLQPSVADVEITQKLVSIFKPLEIKVVDHIIIAGTEYYSMAERGQMTIDDNQKVSYEPFAMTSRAFESPPYFNDEEDEEMEI